MNFTLIKSTPWTLAGFAVGELSTDGNIIFFGIDGFNVLTTNTLQGIQTGTFSIMFSGCNGIFYNSYYIYALAFQRVQMVHLFGPLGYIFISYKVGHYGFYGFIY